METSATAGAEPGYSDYEDLGTVEFFNDVEFFNEERADIMRILTVTDTTKDKLAYTAFSVDIFITCFFVGYYSQYFYIWHTFKAALLISYRLYSYRKLNLQYFLLDFCYFTNLLIMIYIWLPENIIGSSLRGRLFTTCFSFAFGPALSAIVLWRNSLVPHSNDKMTSLFIHVSPSLTMWSLKWFSTPEQEFPLCSEHSVSGPTACENVDSMEALYYPMVAYVIWQLLYIVIVDLIFRKKVKQKNYTTSYTFLINKKDGFLVKIFSVFGPKFRKPMFIALQFMYTLLSLLMAYYCYLMKEVGIVTVTVAMTFAAYNGASFYIDVFSLKYQNSRQKLT